MYYWDGLQYRYIVSNGYLEDKGSLISTLLFFFERGITMDFFRGCLFAIIPSIILWVLIIYIFKLWIS